MSTDSDDDIKNTDNISTDNNNNNDTDNNSEDDIELDGDEAKLKMLKNLKYDFASYEIKYIYDTIWYYFFQ